MREAAGKHSNSPSHPASVTGLATAAMWDRAANETPQRPSIASAPASHTSARVTVSAGEIRMREVTGERTGWFELVSWELAVKLAWRFQESGLWPAAEGKGNSGIAVTACTGTGSSCRQLEVSHGIAAAARERDIATRLAVPVSAGDSRRQTRRSRQAALVNKVL